MHLFTASGGIKKYVSAEDVLEDFYGLRMEFYE
jgi:hypothetical protein